MTGGDDGLYIVLLGRFALRSQGAQLIDHKWPRGKAKALLKVLALAEGRALHREQIMELLWPDLAPVAAANQLRKNLHYLRAELDQHGVASPVTAAHDLVWLAGDVRVDVEEFRELAHAARKGDDPAAYERALQAGEGDLLPEDAFEEWSQAPRQELRALRLRLLTELAALYRVTGLPKRAAELLHRVLQDDPADEAAHRSLIEISVAREIAPWRCGSTNTAGTPCAASSASNRRPQPSRFTRRSSLVAWRVPRHRWPSARCCSRSSVM
jgi:DNA-binding SARP family transcriptional activator